MTHDVKRRRRLFVAALLVALSGVSFAATSVWALNFTAILSASRLVQLVALEAMVCAIVLAIQGKRGRNLMATGLSLSVAGLLFGSGDALSRRFGTLGAWSLFLVVATACAVLMNRVAQSNLKLIRALALWLSLFLFLQPVLTIVFDWEAKSSRVSVSATPPVANSGAVEDFFLLVLDGYASLATLRDEFSFESGLPDVLAGQGFQVVDGAWSPSTWSLVAIPSLVNLEVPLINGEGLTAADSAALYDMVTGNARLFSMFREAGYRLTYVEGGWVGSVCGEGIDECISRPFVDEAIQTVLDRSLLGDLAEGWWGHAFARAGLRSLSEVNGLLQDLGANGTHDMVFAHIMLPHGPYVLGPDCGETGIRTTDPLDEVTVQTNGDIARAAYLDHVQCVDRWLIDISRHVPEGAAVVMTGDHGTLFRGQMLREAADWTREDIAERARTFLAINLPASCPRNSTITSSLEALMDASDCLLGTHLDRTESEKLWLLGRGVTPRCIRQPETDLTIIDIPC